MIGSATILLLILLPILLSIIVSVPSVQLRLVTGATQFASDYLGTRVSIGGINVSMRGGLELYDFLVCDLDRDTMIYAHRVESHIIRLPLFSRRVMLGNTTIQGGEVNLVARLNDDGESEMNIRQISQMLMAKDRTKQPVTVEVSNVVVEGVTARIKQLEPKNPSYGVDLRDLEICDLSASITNLFVDGPALHLYINRLSALERSGFAVDRFSGELYLTEGALALSNVQFLSGWSSLEIKELLLANHSWRHYRDFNRTTLIDIEVDGGRLSSDDVAYFAPALLDCGVMLRNLEFSARGEVANLLLEITNIDYGESTHLNAGLKVVGLPDVGASRFNLTLGEFVTSAEDLDQLKLAFTQSGFEESTHAKLASAGRIEMQGVAEGDLRAFTLEGEVTSEAGEVSVVMSVAREEAGVSLLGGVSLNQIKMGALLPTSQLGDLTMSIDVDGRVAGSDSKIKLTSDVESVVWRNHQLRCVTVAGEMLDGGLEGIEIISQDPYLNFDLRGEVRNIFKRSGGEMPSYDLDFLLRGADLVHLGFNRRDSVSHFSGRLSMEGGGESLERCWGEMRFDEGLYRYNRDTIEMSPLELTLRSEAADRYALFASDYARAEFTSQSSVADIVAYLKGNMARYLPALYGNAEATLSRLRAIDGEDTTQLSQLDVDIYDINPFMRALAEGINIGDGSRMELRFNPHQSDFEMNLSTPLFESGTTMALDLRSELRGRGDSLTLSSSIKELLVGTSFLENSRLNATARDNIVDLRGTFANAADSAYADLGANIVVGRDQQGRREVDMQFLPSTIDRGGERWQMRSNAIKIASGGLDIDEFRVESRDQLMTINGRATTSAADTLRMKMHNFDLSIFSTLIAQLGYSIEGRTNGEAVVSSVLQSRRIAAQIELDSVSVNTLEAPPMKLSAEWDSQLNRARLLLTNRNNGENLVRGFYIPSEVRYLAQLDVDSLQMAMLDPPLGGVIRDTRGTADLSLTLQGRRREAHLNGTVTLHDLSTTIDYTNVRYHVDSAVVVVNDNMLTLQSAELRDAEGGGGALSMQVDLQHLSNIGYHLNLAPRNLLVLDTKEEDNDIFYGRVFASGVTEIVGDRSGVKMNIAARTNANSQFFMPLANKSNISTAEFITFVQPQRVDTATLIQRRIKELERRVRRRTAGNMEINMSLDVRPNTELQLVIDPTVGDIIRSRGSGQLDLRIEPKSNIFDIYGDYTIDEGSYLFTLRNVVNKRFVIDPGSSIQWTGSAMDPILDINAIYQLKTSLQPLISDESTTAVPVDCVINLSDRLTQPDVTFAIDLPSSDPDQQSVVNSLLNDQESISRQFFYLMLANSFIPETSTSSMSSLGVSTTTTTGFELLTNQLSNWLSSSNYNIVIRYRPESDITGDEVDFGFSRGLINNRLLVELEGNYIIDNKQAVTEDASNFMGDAYITWLIDHAGALKLKGFTQTIDRYDENQGLQETGIGIYYRENFNNFRDLQQRVRARFKASDERQARRQARKKEEEEE